MEIQPFALAELEDFSPLSSPLKSSQRIKFNCFDASQSFIVIGASSGGIYVYQRKPCVFLQLIPNTEGAVTQVSISPNENMFAFATVKGIVFLIDHNIGQNSSGSVRKVQVSSDHRGAEVTTFQWNQRSNDLYIGDDKGKITVVSFSFFIAKTIFQAPSFTLMELDSKIVQMDLYSNFLLVSSMSRTYICDTIQEQYKRIGSRPRDGPFGACFQRVYNGNDCPDNQISSETSGILSNGDLQNARIFCARPGARLWEVGIGGDVLSTHKFAEALAVPPSPFISLQPYQAAQDKTSSTGFSKLFPIREQFLFTYEHQSLYVIDPELAHVVLWSKLVDREEIVDARTIGNVAYLWNGSLFALTLLTVEECLLDLYSLGRFKDCVDLCLRHLDYLARHAQSILPLSDLDKKIHSIPKELSPLLEEVTRLVKKAEGRIQPFLRPVHRLESGIHVIGEGHSATVGRKGVRNVYSGIGVMRSRSASPGSSSHRKVGASSQESAKDPGIRKGDSCILNQSSAIATPSSSSPDLVEVTTEQKELSSQTLMKVAVEEDKGEDILSKSDYVPKNSAEALSLKLAERKLRAKWHELEDRVKSITWDFSGEAYEAEESTVNVEKDASDQEAVFFENDVIVQTRNRLVLQSKSVPEIKPLHPVLDLQSVLDITKAVSTNGDIDRLLVPSLFDALLSVLDSFVSKSREESLLDMEESTNSKEVISVKADVLQISVSNSLPFPFRYYFPNDVIDIIVKSFSVLVCLDGSTKWLREKYGLQYSNKEKLHPLLQKCYSECELQDDINFCALLDIFEDIINPLRILSYLSDANGPCRYLLWRKLAELLVIKHSEETDQRSYKFSSSFLPSGLTTVFSWLLIKLKKLAQIDCSKVLQEAPPLLLKEKVPLRHCLYIIVWLCADDNRQNCYSSLLRVLLFSESYFQDRIIQKCAYDAFLEVNKNVHTKVLCQCGFPQFGAQSFSYTQFASIGINLAQNFWKSGKKKDSLKLFWDVGLWRWLLWLLHVNCVREKSKGDENISVVLKMPLKWNKSKEWWDLGVLHLLATLGDKWCLEEWLEEMDEEAWRKFLQLRVAAISGECFGCRIKGYPTNGKSQEMLSDLSWTDVGILMIESLGPETSCRLLMESNYLSETGQLDSSFYKLCMRASFAMSMLESKPESENLMKLFLKRLSSDKEIFSPKVTQLVEGSMVRDGGGWQTDGGHSIVPLPPKSRASNHHWGCSLTLGNGASCMRCSLPIASQVLLSGMSGGLMVFPCGHMLHAVCARSSGSHCPINCPPLPLVSENNDEAATQSWD